MESGALAGRAFFHTLRANRTAGGKAAREPSLTTSAEHH
jgi:hypothetical protein